MTGLSSRSVYAARPHLLRQRNDWSRSPLHITVCERNEFDEIIFRISCSAPDREWTAQPAAATLPEFTLELKRS